MAEYQMDMANDQNEFTASWAFHIHEVRFKALHQAFHLTFPLLERDEESTLQEAYSREVVTARKAKLSVT